MSDVDPLSSAYCKQHDIYLCEVCTIKKLEERLAEYKAENAALREELERTYANLIESNAACVCGCPDSEHESYEDDGLSCGKDEHECIRSSVAVAELMTRKCKELERVKRFNEQAANVGFVIDETNNELMEHVQELESALAAASLELQTARVEIARECRSCAQFETELAAKEEELKALDTKYVKALEAVNDYMYKWGFSLKKVEYLEQREKQLREALNDIQMHVREADFSWESWVYDRAEAALAEGESK